MSTEMANLQLFNALTASLPQTNTLNRSNAAAYAYKPEHKLAQLVMTGCLNQTFYAQAELQLADVLTLCAGLDARFIAQAAIYGRQRGHMKDMPALLLAVLSRKDAALFAQVFDQVIDNGKMLRNFVQIMRSGATGRKSLGSRPKKAVQAWLNRATEAQLLSASIGSAPSLADVIKMVHPKPQEAWREAFFAWVLGQSCNRAALPPLTQQLLAFRADTALEMPNVPFQLLTSSALNSAQWGRLAERMGWQALRMNLNTLARQGVFVQPGMIDMVAARLADPELVAAARVYPYQLLAAWRMTGGEIPAQIKNALQDALEIALRNVPALQGHVVVCPDVSGSMSSPVTGWRPGATTAVRCIDVAALMAAAVLRQCPQARVLPFETKVVQVRLNARDSVLTNAEKLAAIGGGGTRCSAPLAQLVKEKAVVDTVILVSDNESWIDARRHGATETLQQWQQIKHRNPQARLICIDMQPYGTTQAQESPDILNVGGFGDAVFDVVAQFAAGSFGAGHWVNAIKRTRLAGDA
nr:TROVE domain-containing protein [Amantichitinum ursilacus]